LVVGVEQEKDRETRTDAQNLTAIPELFLRVNTPCLFVSAYFKYLIFVSALMEVV
jgi:hypothetical protein